MKITFLEARMPLTKKFTATSKEPYPNAFEFKSHTHIARDLDKLADLMKVHAAAGHCLLKGEIQKELDWESRAHSTDPHWVTRWVCFDLDGMKSVPDIDGFMTKVGAPTTSYILQWSASYGIYNDFSLRAHVLVQLDSPASPSALKIFLKQLNLTQFQSDLELTKTHVALKWGLDVTTCQNDKLIFITPPVCTPPTLNTYTGQRITVVKKQHDVFDFSKVSLLSAEQIKTLEEGEINRLRRAQNLPERKVSQFKMKELKGEQYMPNPDTATVTGRKEERGFVYLNLNGGDSWAYFHPADNPLFIHNFKGEPTYKTSELVPDYWTSVQTARRQAIQAAQQGKMFLAFRDFKTAEYYNGWYDENTEELVLNVAKSEKQLQDFLLNYGQPVPEAVPIWSIVYDPHAPAIDLPARSVNVFRPSIYMRRARAHAKVASPRLTPTIDRVVRHVVGDEMYKHWFNWTAYVFQHCTAPKTAWVAHGTHGTGKGVLVNEVLAKIFGSSNVAQKRMEELEDRFNGYLENSLLCVIDEAQIGDSGRSKMIMANLKNQITEPVITIRRMRQSAYETTNRVGFIFNSNKPDPVIVEAGDRRFNVGDYQPNKIQITDQEIKDIETELQDFAYRLQQHIIDYDAVRTPKINDAKREMQMASRTSADAVADALAAGDLSVLWDALPTVDASLMDPVVAMKLQPYKQLVYELVTSRRDRLTRDELFIIFNYNVGNIASSPWRLTLYLKHHNLPIKDIRVGNKITKGIYVSWTNKDEWFDERLAEIELERTPRMKIVPRQPSEEAQA